MAIRSLPTWPDDKPFAHMPTIDALRDSSGLKIAKLRELLRETPKWKCKDNSVRYDVAAAAAALEGVDALPPDEDDAIAAAATEPMPDDPVKAALLMMRQSLSLMTTVVRERGDVVRLLNETVKTMLEPMKLGQELVRETQGLMRARLEQNDEHEISVLELLGELHTEKGSRERQAQQDAEQAKRNEQLLEMFKEYAPVALEKFSLVGEASDTLELLDTVDPDLVSALAPDLFPKEQQSKVPGVVARMRARRAAREKAAKAREARANGAAAQTVETKGEPVAPAAPPAAG